MTYIDIINKFWSIHESALFSPNEIALVFYLLNEFNRQGWPNTLVYPNSAIVRDLGLAESTIIRCRNNLKMKGALDFTPGKGRRSLPTYTLQPLHSERVNARVNARVSERVNARDNARVDASLNKTIRLKDTPTGGEKKDKPFSLVTRARKIFEEHFRSVYGEAYYYAAKDAGNLKQLLGKIAHSRKDRPEPLPVDDDSLLEAFKSFLDHIDGGWISGNFSLPIINSKYNELISKIKNESQTNGIKDYSQRQSDRRRGSPVGDAGDEGWGGPF